MQYKIEWEPNPGPQTYFLTSPAREVLYGGAVGGGKSEALIMMPLYRCWHPKHQGIIFRRESKELRELIDRQKRLYPLIVPGAKWYESKDKWYWQWPSGAKTWMGYAESELDIEKYKSFEFDLIEWDEVTEFTQYQYNFMFLRNRSKTKVLPAIIRAATNPGGEGLVWVHDRFINTDHGHVPYVIEDHFVEWEGFKEPVSVTRQFIPSTIMDNPKLPNRDQYIAGILSTNDEEMADAYLRGLWTKFRGQYFPKEIPEVEAKIQDVREWFIIRCMDYGWTDQTCVLWLLVCPKAGTIDVAAELYDKHLTTDQIVERCKEVERKNGWGHRVYFSPISPDVGKTGTDGGQNIRTMLQERGYWSTPANTDRKSGWQRIALLIQRGQLRMWRGRAPNLKRTLTKLPRDPRKPNDIKARGVEDHAAEALRYGVMEFYERLDEAHDRVKKEQGKRRQDRDENVDFDGNLLTRKIEGSGDFGLPGWV